MSQNIGKREIAILGEGPSALFVAGALLKNDFSVKWIFEPGVAHASPITNILQWGKGASALAHLCEMWSVETGELTRGHFLREFRNKTFQAPLWTKSPDLLGARTAIKEMLWGPEACLACVPEGRFSRNLSDILVELREKILEDSNLERIEIPLKGLVPGSPKQEIQLGSGETHEIDRAVYCGDWSRLKGLTGMPPVIQSEDGVELNVSEIGAVLQPVGVLQAIFEHDEEIGKEIEESFYLTPHKDPKDPVDRRIWGYFKPEQKTSVWSVLLTPEEAEDNHAITKKLRRIKQTLDRGFPAPDWVPASKKTLSNTIVGERVKFLETFCYSEFRPITNPMTIPNVEQVSFLTDGFGISVALEAAANFVSGLGITVDLDRFKEEKIDPQTPSAESEAALNT